MKSIKSFVLLALISSSLYAAEALRICPVKPKAAKKECAASIAAQAAKEAQRRHTIAGTGKEKPGKVGKPGFLVPPLPSLTKDNFPTVESLLTLKGAKEALQAKAPEDQLKVLHGQIAQINAEIKKRQAAEMAIAGRPALKPVVKKAEMMLPPLPPLKAIPFKAGLIKMKLELAVKRGELKSDTHKKQIDAQIAQIDEELKRRRGVSKIAVLPKPKLAIKVTDAQIKLLEDEFTALSGTMMDEILAASLLMILGLAAKYSDEEQVRVITEIILNNNKGYVEEKMNEFMVAIGLPPEKIEPIIKVALPKEVEPIEASFKLQIGNALNKVIKTALAIKAKFLEDYPGTAQEKEKVWAMIVNKLEMD